MRVTGERETHEAARLRAGGASAAVAVGVLALKLMAFGLTGSAAIFSDAMDSVVNVVAAGMLVLSLVVAARPADSDHPYGHGKIEYFSAGIEGAMIAMAAVLIMLQAGHALLAGRAPQRLELGLGLLVVAGVANATLGFWLLRVGRRVHSPALVADARHALTDVWISGGVLVGLALVRATGWSVLDPLLAFGVAAVVLREGWRLARDAIHGLMDAADDALLEAIAGSLEHSRQPDWIDVHGLRAWRSGANLHVDLHLVVPRYRDAQALHAVHDAVELTVLAPTAGMGDAIVHFDPCGPRHCPGCNVSECPVRASPYVARAVLDRTRATRTDVEAEQA